MSKYEHHQSHFKLRKFLLGFFIVQKQWDPNFLLLCISFLLCKDLQPYSHDRFSKILITFFVKKIITYKTYVEEKHVESILETLENMTKTIIQFEYLQAYSHNCFSKISRTFYASRNLWIIIAFLQRTLKIKLFVLTNTLLQYIPLLALADRQNHRQRVKYTRYT